MAPDPPSWQTFLGIGVVIAATLVVGMALGWFIDSLLHTIPIFILVGLVVGTAAAIGYTSAKVKQFPKR